MAKDFLHRLECDGQPKIEEYTNRRPEIADVLREVLSKKTPTQAPSEAGLEPSFGRFHVDSSERLYVIAVGTANRTFGNYLGRIRLGQDKPKFRRIALKHPFRSFFTNTPRGGSKASDVIDFCGTAEDNPNPRYARIRMGTAKD